MQKIFESLNLYKSFRFRKFAVSLLNNPAVANSYPYKIFHNREIKNRIKTFETTPPGLQVELTTSCNANCIMCPQDLLSREKGVMSMALFKRIIDEAAEWNVPLLHLCGVGETLLDKHIIERIGYAKQKRIKDIRINSNGSLLDKDLCDKLIESGLNEILISIDHNNKSEYEAIRKGLNFDTVTANIDYLVTTRKKRKMKIPKIGINAVAQDRYLNNVDAVYNKFHNRVDYIVFQPAWNWTGDMNIDSPLSNHNKKRFPCPYLWIFLNISWNGDVSICCVDYNNKVVVGNVRESGLKRVWFNETYNRLRNLHLQKKFSLISTCAMCNNPANWWIRY